MANSRLMTNKWQVRDAIIVENFISHNPTSILFVVKKYIFYMFLDFDRRFFHYVIDHV